jgi:hypothetical protein
MLDPREFAFTGMIMMSLGIIGWVSLLGYAYWLWLPKVKRKKDIALDEDIDIRCDDLVNKVHGALMREQEKRYNREKREEAECDARNAERKVLRREAGEREKAYRKAIAGGTKPADPAQEKDLSGDAMEEAPVEPGEAEAHDVEEAPVIIDIEDTAFDHEDPVEPKDYPEKKMNVPWLEDTAELAFPDADKGGVVDDNMSIHTIGTISVSTHATTITQQTARGSSGSLPALGFINGGTATDPIGASGDNFGEAELREGEHAEFDESLPAPSETMEADGDIHVVDIADERDHIKAVGDRRYTPAPVKGRGSKVCPSS